MKMAFLLCGFLHDFSLRFVDEIFFDNNFAPVFSKHVVDQARVVLVKEVFRVSFVADDLRHNIDELLQCTTVKTTGAKNK